MRPRITGIRVECAKRKAHKAIVNYYEENPEQFAKAEKSKECYALLCRSTLKEWLRER